MKCAGSRLEASPDFAKARPVSSNELQEILKIFYRERRAWSTNELQGNIYKICFHLQEGDGVKDLSEMKMSFKKMTLKKILIKFPFFYRKAMA